LDNKNKTISVAYAVLLPNDTHTNTFAFRTCGFNASTANGTHLSGTLRKYTPYIRVKKST
jgi:hypothetical protein